MLHPVCFFFFFSSRRRHTRCSRDWSSDVCSSDLKRTIAAAGAGFGLALALPAAAAAHATLLHSSPADRAVVPTAPRKVRFVFDDAVRVASGIRVIRNGGGSVLGGKPRMVGGKTLV